MAPGCGAALRAHLLLMLATAGLAVAAVAALAGTEVLSVTGRYSNQRSVPFPPVWLLTKLLAQHGAELVFAAAVLPFVGTLVAAYLYFGSRPVAAGDGVRRDVRLGDGVPDRACGLCARTASRTRRAPATSSGSTSGTSCTSCRCS